jgi:hypothetical protein
MGIMRALTALGFAVVLGAVAVILGSGQMASAQSATEWDTQRPSADATRVDEYRTDTTESWIRLSPWVGGLIFADELELSSGAAVGGEIGFEPAELMTVFIHLGYGVDIEREDAFTDGSDFFDTEGTFFQAGLYVGLLNPELQAGPIQAILGFGVGVMALMGYEEEVTAATQPPTEVTLENEDTFLFHATAFLRVDFAPVEQFHLGIDLKVHFPFYANGDRVGEHLEGEFDMVGIVFQPSVYFSVVF